jgi:CHAD domain-containing protein
LRLFAPAFAPGELDTHTAEVRWAGQVLGEARDWDVFVTQSLPPLVAAHGDAELAREMLRRARAHQRAARKAAREAIRSTRYGIAMIRLLRWAQAQVPLQAAPCPLVEFASGRLRKGHKRVRAGAAAFASLGAQERHRLRLAVKRQRYAAEFLGALFRAPRVRRHLRRLADAQEALGAANDGANALAHLERLDPAQGLREFARGWFAARDADGLPRAAATLERAAREKRFWMKLPATEPEPAP